MPLTPGIRFFTQGSSSSTPRKDKNKKGQKEGCPIRKSCPFGASCYRKNPQHKSDEAHPGDDDYRAAAAAGEDEDDDDEVRSE